MDYTYVYILFIKCSFDNTFSVVVAIKIARWSTCCDKTDIELVSGPQINRISANNNNV